MLFRNTDSPNRQSKQPFHHEFISDFHMEDDVGPTSNNNSLAVNKERTLITENAATQTTFLNLNLKHFRF